MVKDRVRVLEAPQHGGPAGMPALKPARPCSTPASQRIEASRDSRRAYGSVDGGMNMRQDSRNGTLMILLPVEEVERPRLRGPLRLCGRSEAMVEHRDWCLRSRAAPPSQ